MSGTWPNMDISDLSERVRTYINETTANFYTDAEIRSWLSLGVKDIAQKTLCVRRILDAETTASTRNVDTNVYKVMHVEYIPSSGRERMLTKIDPLRLGHYPMNGTSPQYWYEFGSNIGIEPIPDAIYNLRLYIADMPKMTSVYNGIAFVEGGGANQWTDGATAWTLSTTATHAGSGPTTLTANTAISSVNTNVTFVFKVDSIGSSGSVTPSCGSAEGVAITTPGIHMQTLSATTPWCPVLTAENDVVISGFYAYVEKNYSFVGDQTELPSAWQHLIILYSTVRALYKDQKIAQAQMLETIYNNELAYLRQNIVEIIPDGRKSLKYE